MKLPDWFETASFIYKRIRYYALPITLLGGYELYSHYQDRNKAPVPEITTNSLIDLVEAGRVDDIQLRFRSNDYMYDVSGIYKANKTAFKSTLPYVLAESLLVDMHKKKIEFAEKQDKSLGIGSILNLVLDFAFLFAIAGGPRRVLNMVGGKPFKLMEKNTGVTFDDIAGIDEAKGELQEIVDFLKNPARYTRLGAKIPKGVLLSGPPGTGKTLLARAIAGEADVPFFSVSGSDFVEMYVGVGASRVRGMFKEANAKAPAIIFIDELDALGGSRDDRDGGGGDDEYNQTLNQLLVGMDGINVNKGIIVIGATNLPDSLDRALTRPGRFDRKVIVPLPDAKGREAILKIHTHAMSLAEDVRLIAIAKNTPGFSGADLANLANEAALSAVRSEHRQIEMIDFEIAKDRLILGLARRSMVLTDAERKLAAYHEGGHALIALHEEGCAELDKVTIIPHGNALGITVSEAEDRLSYSFKQCQAQLTHLFGGREAERKVFGKKEITSGASGDIKAATKLARRMVQEWGMSEKLGPVDLDGNTEIAAETMREIDTEIRRLVDDAQKRAAAILDEHSDELDAVAKALLSRDTLSGVEIRQIVSAVPAPH